MALPRGRYAVEAAWGKFSLNLLISEGQRCNAQGEGSPFGHPGKVSLRISSTWTPREAEPRGRHTIDASWERLGTNFFMGSEFSLLMCIYPLCTSTPKTKNQATPKMKQASSGLQDYTCSLQHLFCACLRNKKMAEAYQGTALPLFSGWAEDCHAL